METEQCFLLEKSFYMVWMMSDDHSSSTSPFFTSPPLRGVGTRFQPDQSKYQIPLTKSRIIQAEPMKEPHRAFTRIIRGTVFVRDIGIKWPCQFEAAKIHYSANSSQLKNEGSKEESRNEKRGRELVLMFRSPEYSRIIYLCQGQIIA